LPSAEVARVLEQGPWPPAFGRDPTNRVSGSPDAIAIGRRLFFDPRFSPNGYVACVACHQPDRGFTDSLPRARGLAFVERNAAALQNLRLHRWYGWGGTSDSLWMASLRPILDAREIGGSIEKVAFAIEIGDGMACRYRAAFGEEPSAHEAETVFVNVGKALAAGVPYIERTDRLVQVIAAQKGMRHEVVDRTVAQVDAWLERNRRKAA
jgi:cytochrome c peroxidase